VFIWMILIMKLRAQQIFRLLYFSAAVVLLLVASFD